MRRIGLEQIHSVTDHSVDSQLVTMELILTVTITGTLTLCVNTPLWPIQTGLDRDWDQEKNGLHYFMFDIHTVTYVGTYTSALYSPGPGPGPVQALSE